MKSKYKPPKAAEWLLSKMSEYESTFLFSGDLCENYERIVKKSGLAKANLWYWSQVIFSIIPYLKFKILWDFLMFKNYLKMSVRNFWKQKVHSLINISGLAIGMAVCFVILLYVLNEYSYDQYHKNKERIYRIICENKTSNYLQPDTPYLLASTMKTDFPEVIETARFRGWTASMKTGDDFTNIKGFVSADGGLLKILTLPLVVGNPDEVLEGPNSLIISEEVVEQYFSDRNPVGRTVTLKVFGEEYDLVITGIFKDIPGNSTFRANFICSLEVTKQVYVNGLRALNILPHEKWNMPGYNTYVLVTEGSDPSSLSEKMTSLSNQHVVKKNLEYSLQPLKDFYFHSGYLINNRLAEGNISYVYLFTSIALLVLLIAIINFIVLSTARSTARSREVGLRKVFGASRSELIRQIIIETVVFCFLSFPLAIFFLEVFKPLFNEFLGREIASNYFYNWRLGLGFIFITLSVGIVSGSYISVYLSRFQPAEIFKNELTKGAGKLNFRRTLIAVQMVISIALIAASIVIQRQLYFMRHQDMGYNKDNLAMISFNDQELSGRYQVFKNEIVGYPGILSVSGASCIPPTDNIGTSMLSSPDDPENKHKVEYISVDYGFLKTLEIPLVEGADQMDLMTKYSKAESFGVIVNESFVRGFGLNEPVGTMFRDLKIVGVMEDFHIHSFRERIGPVMFELMPDFIREMVIRIKEEDRGQTITFLQEKWVEVNPDFPFRLNFFDDSLDQLYVSEHKFANMVGNFTFLAIFLACLGLFSLVSFVGEQRRKEIGIRKVLGASLINILRLIFKEFIVVVVLANVVAWALTLLIVSDWLDNFVYKINIGFFSFVFAGLLVLFIALITISYHAFRSARANPVDSLRYE